MGPPHRRQPSLTVLANSYIFSRLGGVSPSVGEAAGTCQSASAKAGRWRPGTNRRSRPERAPLVGGWWSESRFPSCRRHFVLGIAAGWE